MATDAGMGGVRARLCGALFAFRVILVACIVQVLAQLGDAFFLCGEQALAQLALAARAGRQVGLIWCKLCIILL